MIQVIKYKCCGKIFAACHEPHCYTSRDWLKNLREYVVRGDVVEMIKDANIKFEKCQCKNKNEVKTLDLFNQD